MILIGMQGIMKPSHITIKESIVPSVKTWLIHIATLSLVLNATIVQAQTKDDNYGGLNSYPVPEGDGGISELEYCVVYAKRAWRVANLIEEGSITSAEGKNWAREMLGKNAAAEEIADYERLETKEYSSAHALAANRFFRCATRLRLNPVDQHKTNAETCFRHLTFLDLVARMRADGKTQDQVKTDIQRSKLAVSPDLLNTTINMAFSGPSIAEGSQIIETYFSSCFADLGEQQTNTQP